MERIHVAVRARPLTPEDAKTSPWRISGNSIQSNAVNKFDFDRVFGEFSKTEEVYRARTQEIVGAAVRGFNGTVFAYGQTNSGKTYTMRGSSTEPGVIPLAVRDLFDIIQEETEREFLLRMSYMEIYNEEINDLLVPEHRRLQIHENIERGIYVAGLREEIVVSPEQVLELMQFGESHRHIGETNMNVYSSRSHTIFRMIIESRDRAVDEHNMSCDAVRVSVLNLVDLAGSERAAKTGAEGVRLKEGSHINKSLMTLGTVIKKLSEGAETQGGHVPYRDSKLTRILQPALGGNANTAIICNVALAQIHAEETKSSLLFASRALRVTNHVHVNEILTDAALLRRQKREIEELREKLQGSHSEYLEKEILNLRNTLLQYELERERIALELEEEKRVQAEREKILHEQEKKIKNLSSMVLCSNRDENRNQSKKGKRRDTWCPSIVSGPSVIEAGSNVLPSVSDESVIEVGHETRLLPFDELLDVPGISNNVTLRHRDFENNGPETCRVSEPSKLLHVTSRRKIPPKSSSSMENRSFLELQAAYEQLFLKFEAQQTICEIKIDCLTRQLEEAFSSRFQESDPFLHHSSKLDCVLERCEMKTDATLKLQQLEEKEDHQNLEALVVKMEETNACLEKKLSEAILEKNRAELKISDLGSDMHAFSEKLHASNCEITLLKEEISGLYSKLKESSYEISVLKEEDSNHTCSSETFERYITTLTEEKEDLALRLADALLRVDEVTAISNGKEITFRSTEEQAQVSTIFNCINGTRNQTAACKSNNYKQDTMGCEKNSMAMIQLPDDRADSDGTKSFRKDAIKMAKLKLQLRGTQARLDAYRFRYNEVVEESDKMNQNFEAASEKLKATVASLAKENRHLKSLLSS